MYNEELAEIINAFADEVEREKKDPNDYQALGERECQYYNNGINRALTILRKAADALDPSRECKCPVTEHVTGCPSWGL